MIRRTFQLVPGIGPWREKDLWARGFDTWDAVRRGGEAALGTRLHAELCAGIDRAEAALDRGDLEALVRTMPSREQWRLWPLVADEALCLDIEADGVGERQRPTVAGCLDAEALATFIEGRNLDALPARLAGRRVWVTFNGGSFDLPVLRHAFPGLPRPVFHLDLKPLCRRIGLGGGLKATEDRLGIARPPHLRGRSGMDAVLLWRAYHASGEVEALRFLVEYNLYDAFQLRAVADHAFNRAAEQLHWPDRVQPWDRGVVLYDLSRLLLSLEPTATDRARAEGLRSAEA
ncbi:MAG TPA: ribonuclease H-like domain-containing protein [Myxococcaceae bacterium]|nr:ribonuclease H-like domain-containing protein [Myxococcaceae bacterium]